MLTASRRSTLRSMSSALSMGRSPASQAMCLGISLVQPGAKIQDIAERVQTYVEPFGFCELDGGPATRISGSSERLTERSSTARRRSSSPSISWRRARGSGRASEASSRVTQGRHSGGHSRMRC